jgi:hypothetical protein
MEILSAEPVCLLVGVQREVASTRMTNVLTRLLILLLSVASLITI